MKMMTMVIPAKKDFALLAEAGFAGAAAEAIRINNFK
jgi:hypothetical protein